MSEQKRVRPTKSVSEALQEHAPWKPIVADPFDVAAIKALSRGEADPAAQRRALDFVIRLSRNDGAHYFPGEGGRRDTDFALGRAFVGAQIIALLSVRAHGTGES